ncbi:MAG: aminotransferase class III-fold pyridoxal phosphate-dependent enzyme [Deltaproteobacteria bacterium]|nr:aminotransferase class III-fold pyridoxal phosphate-dependent enzyme [Deltaproteobacteria bacterium]
MDVKTGGLNYNVEEMVQGDRDYVWHHIKPHKLFQKSEQMIVVEGDGLTVKDIRGREYLDATSGGVWGVIVGFGRESIARAVYEQLKIMPYFAGTVGNIPSIKYAKKLIERLPGLGKVFFSNSGSEANEKAFKIVRQLATFDATRKGKRKILFRDRDYHGTTFGALSATGQHERRQDFGPFLDGFMGFPHALCYRCAFGKSYPDCNIDCARCVEETILKEGPETVGACIVEPITAGGGIIPPVKEYYPILQKICNKYDVYLIMDEVVCGFGRTGTFWGFQQYDVQPDMVTMAKGVAASYMPLSVTAVKNEIYDKFLCDPGVDAERMNYFRDISTYGGCAGAMSAALETIRIIEDENLLENSRAMGAYLLDGLQSLSDMPLVGDVRGCGLFCGVEFVKDKKTKQAISEGEMARLMANVAAEGVLVGKTTSSLPGNNTIMNFAPALIATKNDIDRIVAAVKAGIEKF